MDGCARWECEKHKRSLSEGDQTKACDDHLVLPGLIGFAQPLDYDDGCIIFNGEDGQWKHGRYGYSTKELLILSVRQLTNPLINEAKDLFGAVATGFSADDILARYPESDSRVVWKGPTGELVAAWREKYGEDLAALTPIAKCEGFDYQAAEFAGGRVAIAWTWVKQKGSKDGAEIREGVE